MGFILRPCPPFVAMFKIVTPVLLLVLVASGDAYRHQREQMVREQISARGVRDRAVLQAMRTVPRHPFRA